MAIAPTGKGSRASKKTRRDTRGPRTRSRRIDGDSNDLGHALKLPVVPPPSELMPTDLSLGEMSALASVGGRANTILYVHGIGNKPPASVLKCQWDTALFGAPIGDRSRMAYWVNREFYPKPLDETCASADLVRLEDDEASTKAIMAVAAGEPGTQNQVLLNEITALARDDAARQAWLSALASKLTSSEAPGFGALAALDVGAKVIPLPPFLRRLITQQITRAFLRDVNDFLFVPERRDAMERALLDRISGGGGPFVVVAHSQGTMIAWDVLRRLDPRQVKVPLFVTLGSPLGLDEVQDVLRQWTGGDLPFPRCVERWINVADRLDPVSFDTRLNTEFVGHDIEDVTGIGINLDAPRDSHSGTGYLGIARVRQAVREVVGAAFGQAIANFTIAKDLVANLEDGRAQERHATLIQLAGKKEADPANPRDVKVIGDAVEAKLSLLIRQQGQDPEVAEIDRLRNFISARLTRLETEALRSMFGGLEIEGVWRNAAKRALINQSSHTVQARPANLGYGADGRGVCWAILDTGIRADHPHFQKFANVVAQWDCTSKGAPRRLGPGDADFAGLDGHGHGTHVAGIIAGQQELGLELYSGMAPRARLYGFKVLDDGGDGQDAWIIKALDTIASLNEQAGQIVVHGVNLSLGGSFDPSVFGCGHTPLCQELRRLWRQGVLVCLAAGNEGYAVLTTAAGQVQANLDLTIGDPANLEETIAVGSVHKTNPHTFGISYFSSRGPTADGRRKPDLVAPGERVLSARHDWRSGFSTEADLYVEMSGTSMAAPHVSGVLAGFLSLRREFIGYPDRVKEILLTGCVDLRRDPYMQGAGVPNLIKMLALN